MWYEKDFTIPIFCKTVEFKQLYDLGLYNGKFEVSKDQAEKIVKQLDDALERFENSMKQSEEGLSYKELDGANHLHTSSATDLSEAILKLKSDCHLKIFGGCCGTDSSHMEKIAKISEVT